MSCHTPGNPAAVCNTPAGVCTCPITNTPCTSPLGTTDCDCGGISFTFNYNEESTNSIYYALKDPVLTNNKCECLNINADDASIYFENLGIFSNLRDCNKFSNKENAYLLEDRSKLREFEATIKVYSQEEKQKLVNYINANISKEIKTYINEEGEFQITRKVASVKKPAKATSLQIPEIQFMPMTEQTSKEIVETEESKEINTLTKNELVEGIKIDKFDIQEKEQDVKEVDNNAINLMNVLKANTLFNNISDKEKESTQFKDRS